MYVAYLLSVNVMVSTKETMDLTPNIFQLFDTFQILRKHILSNQTRPKFCNLKNKNMGFWTPIRLLELGIWLVPLGQFS